MQRCLPQHRKGRRPKEANGMVNEADLGNRLRMKSQPRKWDKPCD